MKRSVLAAAAILFTVGAARAERRSLADVPCKGCLARVDDGKTPQPLLVVLHGDYGQGPRELLLAWDRFAAPRGVAVLSLACPKDLGCKQSFWQWDGSPQWILTAVDKLAASYAIDRNRLWIAGWSGGSTYMGMETRALERTFAAMVHHGGGYPPGSGDCVTPAIPVYFLVSSGNPYHDHQKALRDAYVACGHDVTWTVVPHVDHAAEWAALTKYGGAILEWLLTKHR
jgi:poly(3-hydroxybutyrate) depolymerase